MINENKEKKNIKYTDQNIFGVNFSKKSNHIKCSIDFLTLNHLLDKNGMLKKDMYHKIRLRYIWQYLVYIRNHNKELNIFKNHLGSGYAIKASKYFELVKLETTGNTKSQTMTKKELGAFITKLFTLHKNLKIPFLEWYKNSTPTKRKKKVNQPIREAKVNQPIREAKVNQPIREVNVKFPNIIKTELKVITDKGIFADKDQGNIKINIKTNVIPNKENKNVIKNV
jgi:hypothetical protein